MNAHRTYLTTSAIALLTLVAASTCGADIISGLEVYYEFEDADNLAENSAGAPGIGWGGLYEDTGPVGLGQAANFGLITDGWYVDVNGKSDPGNGPLSMATWFKTTINDGSLTAVHGSGDASGDAALLAVVLGRPSTLLGDGGSDPGANALVHGEDLADGQWHHMAMTFTGGEDDTLKLFVDGVLSGVRTQAAGDFQIDGWEVGKKYGGTSYFAGSMDDVRMYGRALSDGGVSIVGQTAGGDIAELYAHVIPEPGTFALLAGGSLALMLAVWARRRTR